MAIDEELFNQGVHQYDIQFGSNEEREWIRKAAKSVSWDENGDECCYDGPCQCYLYSFNDYDPEDEDKESEEEDEDSPKLEWKIGWIKAGISTPWEIEVWDYTLPHVHDESLYVCHCRKGEVKQTLLKMLHEAVKDMNARAKSYKKTYQELLKL